MRAVLLLLLAAAAAHTQTTIPLDDFSVMRYTGDGTTPLWMGMANQSTTCGIAGKILTCTTGAGSIPNGLGFWTLTRAVNGYGAPETFLKHYRQTGAWDAAVNKLRLEWSCSAGVNRPAAAWLQVGTYVRHPDDASASNSGQGRHYYHNFNTIVSANEWVYTYIDMPQHTLGTGGNAMPAHDPEYFTSWSNYPVHYWDGLTHFYWGTSGAPEVAAAGVSCYARNAQFVRMDNSAQSWAGNLNATYDPDTGVYRLNWQQPKWVKGGTTFEVRYSTASMRANGWSSGTNAGTATGRDYSPYSEVHFSKALPRETTLYWAVRPRMNIHGFGATNPATVQLAQHSEASDGDQVVIAGVQQPDGSAHPMNGTRTVHVQAPRIWRFLDGSLVSLIANGTTVTATFVSPHGLANNTYVQVEGTGTGLDVQPQNITVTSATTFTFPANGVSISLSSGGGIVHTFGTVTLDGVDGTAWPPMKPDIGTMTATNDKANFAEILYGNPVLVSDSLAYPNGPLSSANWARVNSSQTLTASAGGLRASGPGAAIYANQNGVYGSDQWAQAQLATLPSEGRAGVGVRMEDGQPVSACVADAAHVCVSRATAAGAYVDACVEVNVSPGAYLRADAVETTLTCSLDGMPVTYGALTAVSGRPGLYTYSQTGLLTNYSSGLEGRPAPLRRRYGGPPTSTAATLLYEAPDAGPCVITLNDNQAAADTGGVRSRAHVLTGLTPATPYAFRIACAGGRSAADGSFATPAAAVPEPTDVVMTAFPPALAQAADNLVVDYGAIRDLPEGSVNAACAGGERCSARFRTLGDSVVWIRRRWCRNGALDPGCSDPANELARSGPQAVTVRQEP